MTNIKELQDLDKFLVTPPTHGTRLSLTFLWQSFNLIFWAKIGFIHSVVVTSPKINYKKAMKMEEGRHKELLERRFEQMEKWANEEQQEEVEVADEKGTATRGKEQKMAA